MLNKNLKALAYVTIILSIAYLTTSCVTIKPAKFEYFQDTSRLFPAYIKTVIPEITTIKKGDILGIFVSTLNKESNENLNYPNITTLPVSVFSGVSIGANSQPLGFPVDSAGCIFAPIVGRQKLEGLTLENAEKKIKDVLERTLKEPIVNIRFMNHKFSILGETNRVGTYNLLDETTTILDALAVSGDLTVYAKRDSISIIRVKDGTREIGKVNLRNRDIFSSPYFYIKNGDIIYIEPTKEKVVPPKPRSQNLQQLPVYLSMASLLITVFFRIVQF
ncbi:polysaccharide biosynthesis/export family protein [Spirosoma linguale]|uniref:Soluble ligand binding domain protein n=1 Tax=Spirosoma linguale (strain ATCC 33905 / DSM 74 / LMG 10896 / Claus 1) TaxID=504472 RepID=D2QI97_SPILD|nr:Soluble ligand binding domain protein [Spirosoma linguale DSM 74]